MLSQEARGHFAMLLFSAGIAGSFSLGGLVANEIAPAAINAVRFVIGAAILGAVVWAGPGFRRAHYAAPWRYLLLGLIFAIYFILMFEGLKTAPPVATSAVFTLVPLMAAVFGWFMLGQRTTRRMALALGIGAFGAVWVIFRADLAALLAFEVGRGEAIFFVGCVAHALFTPLLRKLNRGEPALVSTFGVACGSVVALVVVGWPDLWATDWAALPPVVWITILYIAVVATSLTTFLLQYAALRLPSAKVMAYTYLTPSWVIVWELSLGHGVPPALVLPGLGLTIVALLILLKDEHSQRALAAKDG